ncbi:response regulator [Clostridium estertheticum]|uniref:phosphorylase family protein n=1 Tax=Clostridium estertheticum TaxID=238834 RepID=UPI001CF549B3|nr:response regulator [Clostridium estertheticum]MCB2357047.1 response regulator [Clostridium estertheticum]WAG40370.1 response regulator [Clostridium estertheticum]
MINILIVDDSAEKTGKIENALKELSNVLDENIFNVSDSRMAKKMLTEKQFDLLILDINLPEKFGKNTNVNVGIDILSSLNDDLAIKKPTNIVGITAHEELKEEYIKYFNDQAIFVIQYCEQGTDWIDQLQNKVRYILELKNQTINGYNTDYQYDLAIVTALHDVELESVLKYLKDKKCKKRDNDSTIYYEGFFENEKGKLKVIVGSCVKMGMASSALFTSKLISNFRPRYLVMAGVAAGVKDSDVDYGDILLGDQFWDYGSGKMKYVSETDKTTFEADPNVIDLSENLIEKFKNAKLNNLFVNQIQDGWPIKINYRLKVKIGPFASGSAVVQSEKKISEIKQQSRKLIGIDMEAYGVMFAAKHCTDPKPTAYVIKSIQDFADQDKNDNFREYAAYTSASYVYHFALNEFL